MGQWLGYLGETRIQHRITSWCAAPVFPTNPMEIDVEF